MPLQIRRGTNAQRQAMTQALAQGELLYVTDDQRLYIGNGSTLGGIQITGYTDEDAQDAAAQLFVNGAPHTGITFSYNDAGAGLTAVVDLLNNTGTIGGVFKGNVVAEDSTLLIDAASGQIVGPVFANVTGNVTGNLTGNASSATVASTLDITNTNGLTTVYYPTFVENRTTGQIVRADVDLSYRTDTNTLIANTFQGSLTGNSNGFHTGDVKGSVFGDDSTLLIDGISSTVVGPVNNNTTTARDLNASLLTVSGTSTLGVKAGIVIETDGDSNDAYDCLTIFGASANAEGPLLILKRSRGTHDAPLSLNNGDVVASLAWIGTDGSNSNSPMASVTVSVDSAPTSTYVPPRISFNIFDTSSVQQTGLSFGQDLVITVAGGGNVLAAGGGSGQVDTSSVTGYLKVNIGGTFRAIPFYSINP